MDLFRRCGAPRRQLRPGRSLTVTTTISKDPSLFLRDSPTRLHAECSHPGPESSLPRTQRTSPRVASARFSQVLVRAIRMVYMSFRQTERPIHLVPDSGHATKASATYQQCAGANCVKRCEIGIKSPRSLFNGWPAQYLTRVQERSTPNHPPNSPRGETTRMAGGVSNTRGPRSPPYRSNSRFPAARDQLSPVPTFYIDIEAITSPTSAPFTGKRFNRPKTAYKSAIRRHRGNSQATVPPTPRIFRQHPGEEVQIEEGRRIRSSTFRDLPEWWNYF